MAKFLPTGVKEHIKLVVEECIETFGRVGTLSDKNRMNLFSGLITYISDHATNPLPEKYILCISVHGVVQAIMDLQTKPNKPEDPEDPVDTNIKIHVEPWEGEYSIGFFVILCTKLF